MSGIYKAFDTPKKDQTPPKVRTFQEAREGALGEINGRANATDLFANDPQASPRPSASPPAAMPSPGPAPSPTGDVGDELQSLGDEYERQTGRKLSYQEAVEMLNRRKQKTAPAVYQSIE